MAYQEIKTTGYGTRLSNSIKGIATGFLLLIVGSVLLWWNEGRAVKTTKMLEEAQGVAVHVDDVSKVDPSLNGKLIHATAFTQTKDSLSDETFGIGAVAVRLDRKVQYYQWVENEKTETKDKVGGSQEEVTTYTYQRQWVGSPVNSQEFKDTDYQNKNFVVMNLEDKNYMAENVKFGAYQLPKDLIRSISGKTPMELSFSEEQLKQWNQDVKKAFEGTNVQPEKSAEPATDETAPVVEGDSAKIADVTKTEVDTLAESNDYEYVHINGNVLYFGKNPNNPQTGDMTVTFTKILPGEASVIAEVNGSQLQSFVAKSGKEFSVLRSGAISMEKMFENEHKSNTILTWVLRVLGLLLVIFGFKGIFGILITLLKVLPFLADIVGLGVGLVCNVIGFVWSLLVIAIAWLFYRPVISIILLVVVVAGVVYLVKKGRNKKEEWMEYCLSAALSFLFVCNMSCAKTPSGSEARLVSYEYVRYGTMSHPDAVYRAYLQPDGKAMLRHNFTPDRDEMEIPVPVFVLDSIKSLMRTHRMYEYKSRYKLLLEVLDGYSWSYSAKFEDKTEFTSSGDNCYPQGDGFREIHAMLDTYIKKSYEQ